MNTARPNFPAALDTIMNALIDGGVSTSDAIIMVATLLQSVLTEEELKERVIDFPFHRIPS